MSKKFNRSITIGGENRVIGTPSVTVLEFDVDGKVTRARGATLPTDADAGYAFGCQFTETANSLIYINRGTALSASFRLLTGVMQSEVVTATNVITANESGKTFYLSLAGGFTSTLPAPAVGLNFRFVVKTAPTTAYIITTASSANILFGMMLERAGAAGVAGAARDTFNFVAAQSIVGDWVNFESDGTNWYYRGMVDVALGNTVAVT